ncbi:MAG: hypothetical protein WDK95_05550 [Syntrophorhabdaceae bacterium]
MKKYFETPTEESFYNFIKKYNLNIEKIEEENSPDFLVEGEYAFEIKAFNKSGTETNNNGIKGQIINVPNVINKWLLDAEKKINNYKKYKEIKYFSLVIYDNSRYFDSYEKIMPSILSNNLLKNKNINNLIYASINHKNTVALHIKNKEKKIIKIFNNVNCKYY